MSFDLALTVFDHAEGHRGCLVRHHLSPEQAQPSEGVVAGRPSARPSVGG